MLDQWANPDSGLHLYCTLKFCTCAGIEVGRVQNRIHHVVLDVVLNFEKRYRKSRNS